MLCHLTVSVHFGPWLVDEAIRFILLHAQLGSTKIEDNALTSLEAYRWEVNAVWANLDVGESLAEVLVVAPERDDLSVEVDQRADDVADGPRLAITKIVSIAFLHSVAIVSVGCWIVADAVLAVEGRLQSAPANLHEAAAFQHNFVVESTSEDTGRCPDRRE